MGLVDGIFLAPVFDALKPGPLSKVEKCLVDKTDFQLHAIFKKHLDDHPERWHLGAHALFYQTLLGFCDMKN